MPRRKLSVEDAFAQIKQAQEHLASAGINVDVSVQSVQSEPEPQPKRNAYGSTEVSTPKRKATHMVIDLYSKHCVAHAGHQVIGEDGVKRIVGDGVATYGPGKNIRVPIEIAQRLLYNDAVAREYDDKFRSGEQICKLVVQKIDPSGNRVNVGLTVPESVLDPGSMLTMLPNQYTYVIRG